MVFRVVKTKMLILATGNSNKTRCQGFSLIELLVVVLIIGLGTGLVALSVGDSEGRVMRDQMKLLSNRLALVSEQAFFSGQQWGLDLYQTEDRLGNRFYGYRWLLRVEEKGEFLWQQATPSDVAADIFGANVDLELIRESQFTEFDFRQMLDGEFLEGDQEEPDLLLLSSGEITRFQLSAQLQGSNSNPLNIQSGLTGQVHFDDGQTQQ